MSSDGTTTTTALPIHHGSGRARSILATLIAVLAVLACVLALLSLWTFRTLNNTELFVQRVGVIIEDPAVAQEIGDKAAEELVSALDVEWLLGRVLPPKAASTLATPIASGMERYLSEATTSLIGSEQFQRAWDASLTASHTIVIGVLSGESTQNVTTDEGTITVNLVPLINTLVAEAAEPLGELLNRQITPPDVTSDNIDQAVDELNQSLGTDLPSDFGTVTLAQSENLATMQAWYSAIKTIVWLGPIAALVLVGLAVAVARRRLRTLLWIVVGTALLLFFVSLLTSPLETALLNALTDQSLKDAVDAGFTTVLSSLMSGIAVAVALGVLAALALFFTGDSPAAAAGRGAAAAAPGLAARHRGAFLAVGAAVGLLVLALLPTLGWTEIIFVSVLYLAYALAILLAPRFGGRTTPSSFSSP